MSELDERVGVTISKRREALGLSQMALSKEVKRLGIARGHQTWVSRVEAGRQPLWLTEAPIVAEALGCSVSDLLNDETPVDDNRHVRYGIEMSIKTLSSLIGHLDKIKAD